MTRPLAVAMISFGIVVAAVIAAMMMPFHRAEPVHGTRGTLGVTKVTEGTWHTTQQTNQRLTPAKNTPAPVNIPTASVQITSMTKATSVDSVATATIWSGANTAESQTGAKSEENNEWPAHSHETYATDQSEPLSSKASTSSLADGKRHEMTTNGTSSANTDASKRLVPISVSMRSTENSKRNSKQNTVASVRIDTSDCFGVGCDEGLEERWQQSIRANVESAGAQIASSSRTSIAATAATDVTHHVANLSTPNVTDALTSSAPLGVRRPQSQPITAPDCSYIKLAAPPDQQAFYIAKANEWAASPLVGGWFYCRADLVMNWFTYAQQQAAKRPAEQAEDPVPYLFKNGCFGGCEFPNIVGPQTFTFTRTPGCVGCNVIEVSLWYGGHLVKEPDVFDDVDPNDDQVTVTIVAPYVHAMPISRMWRADVSQAQITERPPLPEYVRGMREFMKEKP